MSTKPIVWAYLAYPCSYKATSVLFLHLSKCTRLLHWAYCLNHLPLGVYFISMRWMNADRLQLDVFWFKVGSSAPYLKILIMQDLSWTDTVWFCSTIWLIAYDSLWVQYFLCATVYLYPLCTCHRSAQPPCCLFRQVRL